MLPSPLTAIRARSSFASTLFDLRPPEDVDRLRTYLHGKHLAALCRRMASPTQGRQGRRCRGLPSRHRVQWPGSPAGTADRRHRSQASGARGPADLRGVGGPPARDGRLWPHRPGQPELRALLGYRPDEMVGRGGQEFLVVEDLEPTREQMRLARRGEARRRFRARYSTEAISSRSPGSRYGQSLATDTTSSAAT